MDDIFKNSDNPENSGWTRRFIACEPRLSEAAELYRESGFEVFLAKIPHKKGCFGGRKNNENKECLICFNGDEEKYRVIYTKPQK